MLDDNFIGLPILDIILITPWLLRYMLLSQTLVSFRPTNIVVSGNSMVTAVHVAQYNIIIYLFAPRSTFTIKTDKISHTYKILYWVEIDSTMVFKSSTLFSVISVWSICKISLTREDIDKSDGSSSSRYWFQINFLNDGDYIYKSHSRSDYDWP